MACKFVLCTLTITIAIYIFPSISFSETINNDISGLFEIHWGDDYHDLKKLFGQKLRAPTNLEKDQFESIFTTGKSFSEIKYAVSNLNLYGIEFDILILTKNDKVTEIAGYNYTSGIREFNTITEELKSIYGDTSYTKRSEPAIFLGLVKRSHNLWRRGNNIIQISLYQNLTGNTLRIWSGGEFEGDK